MTGKPVTCEWCGAVGPHHPTCCEWDELVGHDWIWFTGHDEIGFRCARCPAQITERAS